MYQTLNRQFTLANGIRQMLIMHYEIKMSCWKDLDKGNVHTNTPVKHCRWGGEGFTAAHSLFLNINLKYATASACRWARTLSYVMSRWSKSLMSDTDTMITYVPVCVRGSSSRRRRRKSAAIAPRLLMQHLISHNFIQLIYSGRIK